RPAEHLASGVVDAAPVHARLGLGLVLPVVEAVADGYGQRGRHVDEHIPDVVRPARLEHEHAVTGIGREPVRQGAARRAAPDDHEVVRRRRYITSPLFSAHFGMLYRGGLYWPRGTALPHPGCPVGRRVTGIWPAGSGKDAHMTAEV